ncbi:MAG: FtsW/RodA/SpoVE family cell cycle protein [Lysinibacillus sp.]
MINKYIDSYIVLYIGLLGAISCVFIYSSTEVFTQYAGSFVVKQILFYIIGFVLMIGIGLLHVQHLKKFAWIFYGLIVLLLIGLIFAPENIARPINQAKAWYQVKYIGTFQPSEFLKFAFVLVVAKMIDRHYTKADKQSLASDCMLLSKIAIVTIPPMVLVYIQPDTGMLLLYFALLIPMIYFSPISKKILISIAVIPVTIVISIVIAYFQYHDFFQAQIVEKLSPHQISRVNGWLQPFEYEDSSYQTRQGILAIGSGELTGKGFLGNDVYVPEKHTDFLFATIAEETGFIGGTIVILLYFLLLYRLVLIIMKANSLFSYAAGAGIVGLLTFQISQNIGMTMGLLPVTGVTLPFLSYGGSSLLSNFMMIGLLFAFIKTADDDLNEA